MDAAIAGAPVQISDVNSEQPIDLFCKNIDQGFLTKEVSGWFVINITDLNRSTGNGCVHCCSVYGLETERGEKWWA